MAFLKRFYLFKIIIVLLSAVFFARTFFMGQDIMNSFLHGFILIIHEAGHFLTPFGEFFTILGGTLWQLFIPMVIAVYFALSRQSFSAALVLFLVGFSFVDASVYVADARARALPLITMDKSTHDWWNLLRMTGLLEYDKVLAGLFYLQGWLFFFLACFFGIKNAQKVKPQTKYQPSARN